MKEKIKEILQRNKQGLSQADIRQSLCINEGSQFVAFEKAFKELYKDYEIIQMKNGKWCLAEQLGYVTSNIKINSKGIGFIDLPDGRSYRIAEHHLNTALHGDKVVCEIVLGAYAKVIHVLERSHPFLIGTFRGYKAKLVLDDERLKDKYIRIVEGKEIVPVEGLKVQCEVVSYKKDALDVKIIKEIGYENDPGVDILSILLDHDIHPEFPEEVLEEVKKIPQEVTESEIEGREDLRQIQTITIDGDDSKDFDDAVSCEKNENGWLLRVSIADVAHYVKEDSALDKEAFKRGTSTYVTDRVVPMLPQALSNGICSLNPDVDRLTNTCEMQIDKEGNTVSYKLYPSVIHSHARMTYNNVNKILQGDETLSQTYADLTEMLFDLKDCANAIRTKRHNQGAIDFETKEAKIKLNKQGKAIDVTLRERGEAEKMIEDCMIAANVTVAESMHHRDIPSVYRIHAEPDTKKIKNYMRSSVLLNHPFRPKTSSIHPIDIQRYLTSIQDADEYNVLSMMMLRCMQKAKYDANCIGHYGLAEKYYLHFTSPIRRYPDLIVSRMLHRYVYEDTIDPVKMAEDEKKMESYSEQSSIRERISQDAEYECDDMKKAEYMEQFIGERFTGIISGVTSYGFYVELENTVEGMVRLNDLNDDYYIFDEERNTLKGMQTGREYRMGMKVDVVCAGAHKALGQVDFMVLRNAKKKQFNRHTKAKEPRRTYNKKSYDKKTYDRKPHDKKQRSKPSQHKSPYTKHKVTKSRGRYERKK